MRLPANGALARFATDESGAAILEFALVLPVLMILVFGGYELGRVLLVRQALEGSVRAGARYLARVPDPTCASVCGPGAAHAVRLAAEQIAANTGLPDTAFSVAPAADPPPGTVIMTASITVSVDFFGSAGLRKAWTLEARHQEARVAE